MVKSPIQSPNNPTDQSLVKPTDDPQNLAEAPLQSQMELPAQPVVSLPEPVGTLEAIVNVERGSDQAGSLALVELFPHGITVGSKMGRPILILKDKATIEVLPVWMHPLDAGVALAELSSASSSSPHSVTKRVLEMIGLTLESCVFVDIIGHHQYVNLIFRSATELKNLRVRADEAMSFCLQARARFFSTKEFMLRCRSLDADLTSLEQNLNEGQLPGLQAEMENSSMKHPYVM